MSTPFTSDSNIIKLPSTYENVMNTQIPLKQGEKKSLTLQDLVKCSPESGFKGSIGAFLNRWRVALTKGEWLSQTKIAEILSKIPNKDQLSDKISEPNRDDLLTEIHSVTKNLTMETASRTITKGSPPKELEGVEDKIRYLTKAACLLIPPNEQKFSSDSIVNFGTNNINESVAVPQEKRTKTYRERSLEVIKESDLFESVKKLKEIDYKRAMVDSKIGPLFADYLQEFPNRNEFTLKDYQETYDLFVQDFPDGMKSKHNDQIIQVADYLKELNPKSPFRHDTDYVKIFKAHMDKGSPLPVTSESRKEQMLARLDEFKEKTPFKLFNEGNIGLKNQFVSYLIETNFDHVDSKIVMKLFPQFVKEVSEKIKADRFDEESFKSLIEIDQDSRTILANQHVEDINNMLSNEIKKETQIEIKLDQLNKSPFILFRNGYDELRDSFEKYLIKSKVKKVNADQIMSHYASYLKVLSDQVSQGTFTERQLNNLLSIGRETKKHLYSTTDDYLREINLKLKEQK